MLSPPKWALRAALIPKRERWRPAPCRMAFWKVPWRSVRGRTRALGAVQAELTAQTIVSATASPTLRSPVHTSQGAGVSPSHGVPCWHSSPCTPVLGSDVWPCRVPGHWLRKQWGSRHPLWCSGPSEYLKNPLPDSWRVSCLWLHDSIMAVMLSSLQSISMFGISFEACPKPCFGILSVVDNLHTLFLEGEKKTMAIQSQVW